MEEEGRRGKRREEEEGDRGEKRRRGKHMLRGARVVRCVWRVSVPLAGVVRIAYL